MTHWARALTGSRSNDVLGWERNHYDRLVHFSYGLLLLPASVELFDRVAPPRGLWRALLPVLFIMSHSVIYELIEWGARCCSAGNSGRPTWHPGGRLGRAEGHGPGDAGRR